MLKMKTMQDADICQSCTQCADLKAGLELDECGCSYLADV